MGKRAMKAHIDVRRYEAARTLKDMRAGAHLQLSLVHGACGWKINGRPVPADVVALVMNEPHVVSSNDGLFADCPQTFYWAGPA
jgi:hypothetical protein